MSQTTPCQCLTEETPEGWYNQDLDDSYWGGASEYTEQRVGGDLRDKVGILRCFLTRLVGEYLPCQAMG